MSVIESIMGFAGSLVGIITIGVTLALIGTVIYVYKYGDMLSKGTIILFRPKDRRAEMIPIEREEDRVIKCKEINGIPRQYIKAGSSWMIKKKPYFLGMEATGYTAIINQPEVKSIPINEVLKSVWGKDEYKKIPKSLINALIETQWVLNLEPKEINTEALGLPRMSAEDLYEKLDAVAMKQLVDASNETEPKTNYLILGLAAGCGMALTLLAVAMKWIVF